MAGFTPEISIGVTISVKTNLSSTLLSLNVESLLTASALVYRAVVTGILDLV